MPRRIVAAALMWAVLAAPAGARESWDQRAVNAAATELATAARALKGAIQREPQIAHRAHAGDERAADLLESIDAMGKVARRLSRALGDTKGLEETLPLATAIRDHARAARRDAAELLEPGWLQENLAPVEEPLERLGAYYFD